MNFLENKTSIITGCNSGIGLEILLNFAKNKSNVIACYRFKQNPNFAEELKKISKKYEVQIDPVNFDLEDKEVLMESYNSSIKGKKIDVLVNNAGIYENKIIQLNDEKSLKKIFEINLFNTILFTQQILKNMLIKKSGVVLNISSISATENNYGRFSYSATKAGILVATKNMAKEFAKSNIRVNSISPGLINTKMLKNNTDENNIKKTLSRVCLNRLGEPSEIANVALFLCSNLSSYINGQNIKVDGGMFEESIF